MIKQTIFLFVSAASMVVGHHARDVPHRAVAVLCGDNIKGNITFTELEDGKIRVQGTIIGMPAGSYGFHVHEKGDLSGGCISAGSHFNPEHQLHGHPEDAVRHVGDLGNVVFDSNNVCNIDFVDSLLALQGPHNIIGRSVVLHEKADDYGRSDHPDSRKTGNAGGRAACGVIGIAEPVYNYTYSWSTAGAGSSSLTMFLFLLSPITFLFKTIS
ncbi:superoxide dismutase [Cu-Zn]-like [Plodia interpunctella]|uniref:superoxide dismutase [Cu-Zn]-like n=1 Tax=Plodia interpunctella TaxID=58824 RepID=UPI002367490D|nr:superoxide dismutase [Cu-Zn]-like [Plodia interpunctella]XP_053625901.1 superoxide dismutase [Cu-Zn]-like [Plodia interpunctella]